MCKVKTQYIWIVSFLLILLAGCKKDEFQVEVKLPESVNEAYKVLYYESGVKKGGLVESAMQISKGEAKFKVPTHDPVIVYIFSKGKNPATFFYAERGDKIKISGPGVNPLDWKIEGNKINVALTQWREQNKSLLSKFNEGDLSVASEVNTAVAKYVAAHREDPVSTLLLLEYYNRGADDAGFRACWAQLKGAALDGNWREVVSRSDMLELPEKLALPSEMILRSVRNGYDTINFGQVPVLLNFSKPSLKEYRDEAKELRRISEEVPDSSRRVIANILLEPDSLQRWQRARSDSLLTVVEGWAPLGFSDSHVRHFGVMNLPYLVVVDSLGNVVYRGSDITKAEIEFKKQFE